MDDVLKFISTCDLCQRTKLGTDLPKGLLNSLQVPDDRFDSVNIDFCPMPKSRDGYNNIMIIVDRFSKLVELIPTSINVTAAETAKLFYDNWYLKGRGFPKEIVSDRDKLFVGNLWKSFLNLTGIEAAMATSRHQQTDGGAESVVKLLKSSFKRHINHKKDNWTDLLLPFQFSLNNSINLITGFAPFFLAHAFKPRTFPEFVTRRSEPLYSTFKDYHSNLDLAHKAIYEGQRQMSNQYDKHHDPIDYKIGEMVLLNREGINWPPDSENSAKLLQPWLGPFKIIAVDENNNVTLDLPNEMRCHKTFHVSKVKKWLSPNLYFEERLVPNHPPPIVLEDGSEEWEIESILDHKLFGRGRNKNYKFLVKWKGYGPEFDSWQSIESLSNCLETVNNYLEIHPIANFDKDRIFNELKDPGRTVSKFASLSPEA